MVLKAYNISIIRTEYTNQILTRYMYANYIK